MSRAGPWDVAAVKRWLVIAHRADPRERSLGVTAAMNWPALYLLQYELQITVSTWAWATAGGHSISALLRGRPSLGSRATFERRLAAGLAKIAANLNRDENQA